MKKQFILDDFLDDEFLHLKIVELGSFFLFQDNFGILDGFLGYFRSYIGLLGFLEYFQSVLG
jgi:hypothetical protein